MRYRAVLLLFLLCFCTAGCVKRAKIVSADSSKVTFQSIPFELQIADQLKYIDGGERVGNRGADKVIQNSGTFHEWITDDKRVYLMVAHQHLPAKTVWHKPASDERRVLITVNGINLWYKKKPIYRPNNICYWEELMLYHTGADRVYIRILSRSANIPYEPVQIIPTNS